MAGVSAWLVLPAWARSWALLGEWTQTPSTATRGGRGGQGMVVRGPGPGASHLQLLSKGRQWGRLCPDYRTIVKRPAGREPAHVQRQPGYASSWPSVEGGDDAVPARVLRGSGIPVGAKAPSPTTRDGSPAVSEDVFGDGLEAGVIVAASSSETARALNLSRRYRNGGSPCGSSHGAV